MFSASKSKGVSGSYQVANSLRFRSSASAYLNRTFSVAGNRQTWTWSGWVKRGILGAYQAIFCQGTGTASNGYAVLRFTNSDTLTFYSSSDNVTTNIEWTTSAVFRDPSAWYHVIAVLNTTQATASDRLKIYVNGTLQTGSYAITPSQNLNAQINTAAAHQIGVANTNTLNFYSDCYMAEINFIDGQALTPSSFGQISTVTGVWQPKTYSGTYGTNGFKLNFSNGTSTTTLGYDSSGNSNNWTPNNISLTAGSTYDWMLDSPTPFAGSSYGVGNYAVLNPLIVQGLAPYNANLTLGATTSYTGKLASIGISSGKWYWEQTIDSLSSNNLNTCQVYGGVATAASSLNGFYGITGHWGFANTNTSASASQSVNNGTLTNGYTIILANDVVGLALDMDSGSLSVYRNNVLLYSVGTSLAGNTVYPVAVTFAATGNSITSLNFGQRPFSYTPPTGFKSLCTYNLPAASIVNGASYMAATTYTGTGASLSVSGAAFQPDLVWIKSRSAATDNKLTDVIRGTTNALISNSTAAATTDAGGVTAFNSNGFTVGTTAAYNTNAATYIAWQWKANGAAVTNNAGSISSQVSANTTAGFSVVTYTGTGANATVGHGLGVAPAFLIVKNRSTTTFWDVWHQGLGGPNSTSYLYLNSTSAAGADGATTYWGTNSFSSTTFSVGPNASANGSGNAMVAYCFAAIAGYSAFGSFSGNASTDGVFVYTGFLPRLVMVKCSSGVGNWFMLDSSRNTYNVVNNQLYPNLSNAESAVTTLDILSNGFKMRTSADPNASATYVYAAWAESLFQNSLAR